MEKIKLVAGREAYQWISQYGIRAEDVQAVVAAAGGPKWFTTYGLVRFILGDLLRGAEQKIDFVGSSVGSWQMATALTQDPFSALDRMKDTYAGHIYSEKPSSKEISDACEMIIRSMLDDQQGHVIDHNSRSLHIMTSRGKGLLAIPRKVALIPGFASTIVLNMAGRKNIRHVVERVVFSSGNQLPYKEELDILPTYKVRLNQENLIPAFKASGSIPLTMQPVLNPPYAPEGVYWDGGITDYHITLPYSYDRGIVLHPHFGSKVLPGWFDKQNPRKPVASEDMMSRVLLIYPSDAYIDSLPRKRISDLRDFYEFGTDQTARIHYWREISQRSHELASELKELVDMGTDVIKYIKPYTKA